MIFRIFVYVMLLFVLPGLTFYFTSLPSFFNGDYAIPCTFAVTAFSVLGAIRFS